MRLAQRLTVVGALVGVLAACSTEGDEPAPPVEAASAEEAAGDDSESSGDASGSTGVAGDSVPRVIESDLKADSLGALVRLAEDAGLDCRDASAPSEAKTHTARACSGALFAYFTDVDAMDGYVTGYVDKGNHVVLGDNWFVTGKPGAIEPLVATLQGE